MNTCKACQRPFLPTDGDPYRQGVMPEEKVEKHTLYERLWMRYCAFCKSHRSFTHTSDKITAMLKAVVKTLGAGLLGAVATTLGVAVVLGVGWCLFPGIHHLGRWIAQHLHWQLDHSVPGKMTDPYEDGTIPFWLLGIAPIAVCVASPFLGKFLYQRFLKR